MAGALLWWLVLLLIGLAALPISLALFRSLPDRGYAFSRPVGLVLVAYLFWTLGLAGVLPTSRVGAGAAFLIVAAMGAAVAGFRRRAIALFLRRQWGIVLATEGVFAAVFVLWAIIRSYTPAIGHTEQPMDFAFLNGILRSPDFPPRDPWFAGQPISYYYGGHLMTATLAHLSGIRSSIAYNLSLASTAAMAAAGVASVVYNLVRTLAGRTHGAPEPAMRRKLSRRGGAGRALIAGGAGVVLLLFTANLVGMLELFRVNGIGSPELFRWIGIDGLTFPAAAGAWYPTDTWWWWRATRVINTFVNGSGIDYTITEFPFFSFLLGDMHPHVMSLPLTVMAVALGYAVLRSGPAPGLRWLATRPWAVLLMALLLGSLGFVNSWDLPTFTALFLTALTLRAYHGRVRGEAVSMASALGLGIVIAALAMALYAPFYMDLGGQASGILPVRRVMTRPLHLTIVLGPLLLLNLSLLAALAWSSFREPAFAKIAGKFGRLRGNRRAAPASPASGLASRPLTLAPDPSPDPPAGQPSSAPAEAGRMAPALLWAFAAPLAPFVLWSLVEVGMTIAGTRKLLPPGTEGSFAEALLSIGSRFWHLLPFFALIGTAIAVVLWKAAQDRGRSAALQFVLLLMAFALMLLMGTDLFFIADFFGNRMNTVFKFTYQAWTLLAIGGAVSLFYWYSRPVQRAWPRSLGVPALVGLFAVVLLAAFVYVPAAIIDKTGRFRSAPTLDGLAYVRAGAPGEYRAAQWLRDNAGPEDVLVEAVPGAGGQPGGDYNPAAGRFSGSTGVPAILGWPGHEHQWRGNPFAPIAERYRDVETIYRSEDQARVHGVLQKYGATYVIVGPLEREVYGPQAGRALPGFMDIAFPGEGVLVYRVPKGVFLGGATSQ